MLHDPLSHRGIGVFQAWGALDDPGLRGNTIIDSLMNMPLLYWAAEQTARRALPRPRTGTRRCCVTICPAG
jgi:hypothetical protein